jgi:hypothetical protein
MTSIQGPGFLKLAVWLSLLAVAIGFAFLLSGILESSYFGGNTTVPMFQVDKITRKRSCA